MIIRNDIVYICSVLWLNVLSIDQNRRLTTFGCQNGSVGLSLVNQKGPGEKHTRTQFLLLKSYVVMIKVLAFFVRLPFFRDSPKLARAARQSHLHCTAVPFETAAPEQ